MGPNLKIIRSVILSALCAGLMAAAGTGIGASASTGSPLEVTSDQIVVDPAAPSVQYVIYNGGLWRSRDGGVYWQPVGPPGRGARSVVARHGGRDGAALRYGCACGGPLAGYATSVLYLLQDDGLYHSFDQGDSWSRLIVSGARPAEMASLQLDRNNDGKLYAVLARDGNLLRSLDAGYTWRPWSSRNNGDILDGAVVDGMIVEGATKP